MNKLYSQFLNKIYIFRFENVTYCKQIDRENSLLFVEALLIVYILIIKKINYIHLK